MFLLSVFKEDWLIDWDRNTQIFLEQLDTDSELMLFPGVSKYLLSPLCQVNISGSQLINTVSLEFPHVCPLGMLDIFL